MTEQNEKLIEQKKAEIKRLQEEITNLRGHAIANMLSYKMLNGNLKYCRAGFYGTNDGWKPIRQVCMEIHRFHHYGENLVQKNLDKEEKEISAKMADEIICIWNKYMEQVYRVNK